MSGSNYIPNREPRVPKDLTQEQEAAIIECAQAGMSIRQTAKALDLSMWKVRNYAVQAGAKWGGSEQTKAATEATIEAMKAERAELVREELTAARHILGQLYEGQTLHNFDVKGNYSSVDIDEPDSRQARDYAAAAAALLSNVDKRLEHVDRNTSGESDMKVFLNLIAPEKAEDKKPEDKPAGPRTMGQPLPEEG